MRAGMDRAGGAFMAAATARAAREDDAAAAAAMASAAAACAGGDVAGADDGAEAVDGSKGEELYVAASPVLPSMEVRRAGVYTDGPLDSAVFVDRLPGVGPLWDSTGDAIPLFAVGDCTHACTTGKTHTRAVQ
jgi:hypothetical protein